jgi:TolB-like protein
VKAVLDTPIPWQETLAPPATARVAVIAPLHTDRATLESRRLGESISEILAVALSDQKRLAVVDRSRLAEVMQEQKLALSGLVDPATAVRVGKLLAAEIVVAGSLLEDQDQLRGTIQVIAVDGQRVLGSVAIDTPRATLVNSILPIATRVAALAGVKLPALKEEELDDSPVGRVHLMRGIGLYYANNPDLAIASCLRAVQLDPRLVEARLWIARSYLRQGEKGHARAELNLLSRNPASKQLAKQVQQLFAECAAP